MSWFYTQRWAAKRWSYIGKEMPFDEAEKLFNSLNSSFSETYCYPLALIRNGDIGKVIQKPSEKPNGWLEIIVNAMYKGNPEPLILRVSNE